MALHLDSQKVNSFTPNDFGDSPAQKKWFFGGLGPWNVKLGLGQAKALSTAGMAARPEHLDYTEHAAWTAFANVLLNLDETITRN